MKLKLSHGILLTLLAVIFMIGLTFASIELPRLIDDFLGKNINTPNVATGLNELSDYKTELYFQYFHLRIIGYSCLALLIVLIIVGFVTEKTGITSAGALMLFLPVFGHFAATMFFLGGLGFLRLLWLPLLDVSFNLFRLGDIINLPYHFLEFCCTSVGINPWPNLSWFITALGLLIFLLGTLTWFYARMQQQQVANFWIYRLSRHPQYLGWIIWSYGILYMPGSNIRLCYELSNTLPWLISTMIIIGIAMLEELKMKRIHGEKFESYQKKAPFLFPLPGFIVKFFTLPLKIIFRKEYPERKREIVSVLAIYTIFCLGVSAIYGGFVPLPANKTEKSHQSVEELVLVLKNANNFSDKREAADELEKIGEPAMQALIALLHDPHPRVRAYSAGALGSTKSEQVVQPLISLLNDTDSYVRRMAISSLGRIGSLTAIQPLVQALDDPDRGAANSAVNALGQIKHPSVLPYLINALENTSGKLTGAAAVALGEQGKQEAIAPLVRCLEERPDCPYNVVGDALWKLRSDRAIDAWIMGLEKGTWWYARAACATALGRNKLEKGIEPLQEALKDTSVEVRRAAVLALMEFQSEKISEALRTMLNDNDLEVRMYAEDALRKMKASSTE